MTGGFPSQRSLSHWGRVTHICVGKLTIIGSVNGLSPGRRQAIIWTNAGILLFGPLRSNFSEIIIEIHTFSFKKMHLRMLSGKWRLFCLGLNVLMRKAFPYRGVTIMALWYHFSDRSVQINVLCLCKCVHSYSYIPLFICIQFCSVSVDIFYRTSN